MGLFKKNVKGYSETDFSYPHEVVFVLTFRNVSTEVRTSKVACGVICSNDLTSKDHKRLYGRERNFITREYYRNTLDR